MITWNEYIELFNDIAEGRNTTAPYDKESFLQYVALNEKRQARWLKKGQLNSELVNLLSSMTTPQQWILITEPWCGDASHTNPFIELLAQTSEHIHLSINLRDGNDSLIKDYLTNGGMSIPILIVRDEEGNDLFKWGPRPEACQALFLANKMNTEKSEQDKKVELQGWYNKDKGQTLQLELLKQFKAVLA